LFEGDDEAVRPTALLGELFEEAPACGGLVDLFEPAACLREVGLDAEADPWGGVTLGLIAASLDFLEDAVVVGGVFAEVLLDGSELGGEQSLAGEDERLNDPGDATVAVAERVHRNDVQVCHRCPHDNVCVEIAAFEPVDYFAHQ
jgi:hypothetical protein